MSAKSIVFVIAVILVVSTATPLVAQNPSFPDFSSTANLHLNGSALKVNNVLQLNPSLPSQAGSAWYTLLQPVAGGFSTTFSFKITNPSNPSADGIAFVIQNSGAGLQALGDGGGGIGYQGMGNSLAIEFDTYANFFDPEDNGSGIVPANHIAILSCGTDANSANHNSCGLGLATSPVLMADGGTHTVRIDYQTNVAPPENCGEFCPTSFMQVTIDGSAVFEGNGVAVDLSSLLSLANPSEQVADSAYVGFTGATGDFQEENDILSWTFTPHAEQTITQNNLPPNQFTTFNFGSYLYKVKPNVGIDTLQVKEVPTDPGSFNAGTNFPGAHCIIYDSTGGKCVEFHAQCTGATCSNVSYDVVTSYDVPSGPPITNPGFLKATGQDCVPGITFDSNIITAFLQTRTDPTTKGSSRPSFSCFVAVSNVTYAPADLDIVNLASLKVKQGANLTYVATATNFGPSSAQGVAITNTIPAGTSYVASSLCTLTNGCSSDPCSFAAATASCTVGNLDKFGLEFMVLTVKVTANPGTILSDTATITAFNPDPDRKPDRSWTMKTTVTK